MSPANVMWTCASRRPGRAVAFGRLMGAHAGAGDAGVRADGDDPVLLDQDRLPAVAGCGRRAGAVDEVADREARGGRAHRDHGVRHVAFLLGWLPAAADGGTLDCPQEDLDTYQQADGDGARRVIADLRSDTLTQPTAAMRAAMAAAPLGDDVYSEDPTVNQLEEQAAEILGKEAALLCVSGSMGNLVAMLAWVPRGGEIIAGESSHTLAGEAGGYAVLVGASARSVARGPDGMLPPAAIAEAFRTRSRMSTIRSPRLVTIENTYNAAGGLPLGVSYTEAVAAVAHERGVPLHLDGARLFNAVVALGVPAAELCRPVDSVMIALSKGLACPVGSIVAGSAEFVARARRARKLVGGGMRQAGIIAAAGVVALRYGADGMIDRMAEDHANARRLAEGLAMLPFISVDLGRVRTNFVMFQVAPTSAAEHPLAARSRYVEALDGLGVRTFAHVDGQIRAVTHVDISAADIDRALDVFPEAWRAIGGDTPAGRKLGKRRPPRPSPDASPEAPPPTGPRLRVSAQTAVKRLAAPSDRPQRWDEVETPVCAGFASPATALQRLQR